MPSNTFTLISSTTVGAGGTSAITFSSIPATYTDLCLKLSLRYNIAIIAGGLGLTLNGSTANFTYRYLEGNGSAASSGNGTGSFIGNSVGASATSNTFSNTKIYIPNYAGSTYKSISIDAVTENNATTAYADLLANLWSVTSAINSISIDVGANSFVQYSTAYLYGIKNS